MTELPAPQFRDLADIQRTMYWRLSESDRKDCQRLVSILLEDMDRTFGMYEVELNIAEALASSLYSDACKKYFAAKYIHNDFVLLLCDRFLTEEIILGHIDNFPTGWIPMSYFERLIGSKHLSARLLESFFRGFGECSLDLNLGLIPDSMITSKVLKSWMVAVSDVKSPVSLIMGLKEAAFRVKQVHPEYEDYPDDWVLKVFCG